jgi:hypothetical protein
MFEVERSELSDIADQHLEDSFSHVKFPAENQIQFLVTRHHQIVFEHKVTELKLERVSFGLNLRPDELVEFRSLVTCFYGLLSV